MATKTAQLRALGWNISPVPVLIPAGPCSAAYTTTEHPREWLVNPPEGHPVLPRKIEGRNSAIRWAWAQATAPRLDPSLAGVASLAALASAAATSGKVMEGEDEAELAPARPDAELIALCREVMACEQSIDGARENFVPWYVDKEASQRCSGQLSGAMREKERLVPLIFDQEATTHAGLYAMAEVLGTLYENSKGTRAFAVRSLVGDLLKVLGEQQAEDRS